MLIFHQIQTSKYHFFYYTVFSKCVKILFRILMNWKKILHSFQVMPYNKKEFWMKTNAKYLNTSDTELNSADAQYYVNISIQLLTCSESLPHSVYWWRMNDLSSNAYFVTNLIKVILLQMDYLSQIVSDTMLLSVNLNSHFSRKFLYFLTMFTSSMKLVTTNLQ